MMGYQRPSHEAQQREIDEKKAAWSNSTIAGASIGQQQVRPRSSIEENLERIAMGVSAMEEQLERLTGWLTPVLSARPEANNPVEKALGPRSESPLGDQAARIAAHVDRINRNLSHLIDGVDL
jgi:hypothetical protein